MVYFLNYCFIVYGLNLPSMVVHDLDIIMKYRHIPFNYLSLRGILPKIGQHKFELHKVESSILLYYLLHYIHEFARKGFFKNRGQALASIYQRKKQ